MLFGYESHIGIPILNLYLVRLGLFAGYNFLLEYDTLYFPEPDIRKLNEYFSVVKNGTWNDFVYIRAEGTLSPNLGLLAKIKVTAGVQVEYHIRENRFRVAAKINAKF